MSSFLQFPVFVKSNKELSSKGEMYICGVSALASQRRVQNGGPETEKYLNNHLTFQIIEYLPKISNKREISISIRGDIFKIIAYYTNYR